ncbi:MAG: hypothetical protein ACOZBL_03795 [Patescibacteria group bacterium]
MISTFQSVKSKSHIIAFSKVDFHAQFFATKAIFCPEEIVKSTHSNKGFVVYDFIRFVACIYNIINSLNFIHK